MTAVVGVRGGLSVDHLVAAGHGARFDELGGPGLFGALGARLVAGTQVRLYARLPDDEPRFAKVFQELGIDTSATVREPQAMRLWMFDPDLCESVLRSLVESHFLVRTRNAIFLRAN